MLSTLFLTIEVITNGGSPISLICLFDDLIAAIDLYASSIPRDSNLELKFQQTANALIDPEVTQLSWW